jgi:4-hydroxy-3-methylbut-2-enyl diphosphate reductase
MATAPLFLTPLRIEQLAARAGAPGIEVARIGLGPARATAARARVLRERRAGVPVLLLGLGGGLMANLKPGSVVVATALTRLGGDEVVTLGDPRPTVQRLRQAGLSAVAAPIVSSPHIVSGAAGRAAAGERGAAVDMESFWLAGLVERHPFVVCRVVIDVPGRDVSSIATPFAAAHALSALVRVARAMRGWSSGTLITNPSPLLEVGDR